MTEQDERIIYEWLDKRLLGLNWQKFGSDEAGWEAIYERPADLAPRQRYGIPIPLLDMNFAFDVCVPKLRTEGFQVDIWTYEGEGKPFGVRIHGYLSNSNFAKFVRLVDTSLREAFYDALLAYIKGNTNA